MTNYYTSLSIGAQESATVEFKTSLFFKAGSSVVDESQMDVITRTIASMMNMEGGSLYIGVNDRGQASKSINDEFGLLNLNPPYHNNAYPTNLDGYKRFILDWVSKNLGNFATTLLSFEVAHSVDVFVCRIDIKKSKVPIWFK